MTGGPKRIARRIAGERSRPKLRSRAVSRMARTWYQITVLTTWPDGYDQPSGSANRRTASWFVEWGAARSKNSFSGATTK